MLRDSDGLGDLAAVDVHGHGVGDGEGADLAPGAEIKVDIFAAGQVVDVALYEAGAAWGETNLDFKYRIPAPKIVEPQVVVSGNTAFHYATQFNELGDNALKTFAFRGLSPAICDEMLHLVLRSRDAGYELGAFAADGRQVMSASAS